MLRGATSEGARHARRHPPRPADPARAGAALARPAAARLAGRDRARERRHPPARPRRRDLPRGLLRGLLGRRLRRPRLRRLPPHVFGSGFKAVASGALFVTPSHTLDALYALRRGDAFTVSNSLAFLARFAGLEPRFDFDIG